jgi:hypothetical protein
MLTRFLVLSCWQVIIEPLRALIDSQVEDSEEEAFGSRNCYPWRMPKLRNHWKKEREINYFKFGNTQKKPR